MQIILQDIKTPPSCREKKTKRLGTRRRQPGVKHVTASDATKRGEEKNGLRLVGDNLYTTKESALRRVNSTASR